MNPEEEKEFIEGVCGRMREEGDYEGNSTKKAARRLHGTIDEVTRQTEESIAFLTQEGNEMRRRIEENDRKIKALRARVQAMLEVYENN